MSKNNKQPDELLPTEAMCDQARGFIMGLDLNVRKFGAMQKHLDLGGYPTCDYIKHQAEHFPDSHITKWEVAECIWLLMQQKAPERESVALSKYEYEILAEHHEEQEAMTEFLSAPLIGIILTHLWRGITPDDTGGKK